MQLDRRVALTLRSVGLGIWVLLAVGPDPDSSCYSFCVVRADSLSVVFVVLVGLPALISLLALKILRRRHHWIWIVPQWSLVALGAFIAIESAVIELREGRLGFGTGICIPFIGTLIAKLIPHREPPA